MAYSTIFSERSKNGVQTCPEGYVIHNNTGESPRFEQKWFERDSSRKLETANKSGIEFGTSEHSEAIQSLRKRCVDHIRQNADDFHIIILSEVCELQQLSQHELHSDVQKALIDEYVTNLQVNRTWCGAETIISVSQIFDVNITVHTENAPPLNFESPNGGSMNINLYFSGHPTKNHYDVVMRVSEDLRQMTGQDTRATGNSFSNMTKPIQFPVNSRAIINLNDTNTNERMESQAVDSNNHTILDAVLSCLIEADPMSWPYKMNVLNLKKAMINEIDSKLHHYKEKLCLTEDQLKNMLTHWDVVEQDIDVAACYAIANLIKRDIVVFEKDTTQLFQGINSATYKQIHFERRGGAFFSKPLSYSNSVFAMNVRENSPSQMYDTTTLDMEDSFTPGMVTSTNNLSYSHNSDKLTIASINVRGCSTSEKRNAVDTELRKRNIDICAIQETRTVWASAITENYNWHFSPTTSPTSHRDGRKSDVFAQITGIISKIPHGDEYIIIGDFNGHIGSEDIKEEFKQLIGKQLLHRTCNKNVCFLLQLATQFELSIRNTFANQFSKHGRIKRYRLE
ncbi:uncharacterized protein LOC134207462 [Armigeres subalbatus]|uniref:uncharacterized protein LOC134207462 n=1 Tax=Armigeres subalbatus TaxID=124917 RepID=UPI002ED03A0B